MSQSVAATSPDSSREARDQALFDRIAEDYCKKDLTASSGIARTHRTRRTILAIPEAARGDLLDVGCGGGFSARQLRGRCRSLVGIDYSSKLIEFAREHNADERARFEVADLMTFEPETRFDAVLMVGVLHHIPQREAAVARMVELLKPGGWVVVNEPHPGNPVCSLARRVRARLDGTYSEEQDELSAREISELYRAAGLTDIHVRAQGVFSTPFAEVPVGPAWLTAPLSRAACFADAILEKSLGQVLRPLSWNIIVAARKPSGA